MPRSDERAWQDDILDALPSGIDPVQVQRCLRLSPTERLDQMRQLLIDLEQAKAFRDDRLPRSDRSPR
jgi:hypothetical protein